MVHLACIAFAISKGDLCKAPVIEGHRLCRTHLQQEMSVTCIGITGSGSRCMAGTMVGSDYCNYHVKQSFTSRSRCGRITGSSIGRPTPTDDLPVPDVSTMTPTLLPAKPTPRVRKARSAESYT